MVELEPIPSRTDLLLSAEVKGLAGAIRTYANALAEALENDDPVRAWNDFLSLLSWVDVAKHRLHVDVRMEG